MKYSLIARLLIGGLTFVCFTACVKVEPAPNQIGDHLYFAGDSVRLSTNSDGAHAFVTGSVGSRHPLNFIVDTGSPVNVIDREIAETMELTKIGEKEVLSGGVEPVTADIVVVPKVTVDGLTIKNAEFLTMELSAMSLGQLQGVLGMTLFDQSTITFDPANDRIVVSQAELTTDDAGVIAYDRDAQSGFRIEAEVVGQPITMNLDTGAPSSFTFPLALSATIPLQGALRDGPVAQLVGGQRSIKLGTVDGVIRLGEINYDNPQVAFIDPSATHGNIGNAVLRDLVLSIDQRNGLLQLQKSPAKKVTHVVAAENADEPRRLGMQLRSIPAGTPPTVTLIDSGSLSERAGLKIGDVLVSVNGQPMQELDFNEMRTLFNSATPLSFVVERAGEPFIVEIR